MGGVEGEDIHPRRLHAILGDYFEVVLCPQNLCFHQRVERAGGGVYLVAVSLGQHPQPGDVVGMFMGDENSLYGAGIDLPFIQRAFNPPGAYAGVHQHAA